MQAANHTVHALRFRYILIGNDTTAVWCFDWLRGMPGALPEEIISAQQFPRVFAWLSRFSKAVKESTAKGQKPTRVNGDDAASTILNAAYADPVVNIDQADPTNLKQNARVEVWPSDSGFSHKDIGELVGLQAGEIVLALANGIHLHFPRAGFRIREISADSRL